MYADVAGARQPWNLPSHELVFDGTTCLGRLCEVRLAAVGQGRWSQQLHQQGRSHLARCLEAPMAKQGNRHLHPSPKLNRLCATHTLIVEAELLQMAYPACERDGE